MSLVKHILKNDIRRLRVFLAFWLPVVLLAASVNFIRPAAGDFALQAVQESIIALTTFLQLIMMALMVPAVMHSEPLTGTTAFWFTRPMEKTDIMKAKLLFGCVFFVVLPSLVNTLFLVASRVPESFIFPMVLEYLLRYSSSLLLFMAMASLTANFGQYARVGSIYLAIGMVFGAIMVATQQYDTIICLLPGTALADSRYLLSELVSIAILSLLIYTQYRRRRTMRSYVLLAVEFFLALWISTYAPWSIFTNPVGSLSEKQSEHVSITVDKTELPYARDVISMGKVSQKEIWGKLRYEGLPENCFARENQINVTFEVDGCEVNKCRPEVRALGPGYAHIEALQAALEPLDLIPERNHDYYPNRLLKLSMSDYLAARHDAGIYRADISFDVYQYQRLACLPLRAGQEFATARARIGIASVLAETEGCTVIIREQYINPLFMRNRDPMPGSRFLYLLVNSETKEAFLPERNHQNAMRGDHASFVVMNKPLQFSSSNKATYSIDETWLENAELVIVEAQWIGEAHHDLEDLTFRLEKSPPAPKVIPDTSAKDNLEKLAAIHLPENPNRNEVRSYIKEIHSISATQESFSGKDPQIGMLLQIDPEHLDLLIQTVLDSDPNYYERRALRVLAQPEHKDLVLRYLFQVPVLASAVNHYGWQEDAREILLEGLREKETLPEDWLVAVIRLNDPTTYSLLADFFVRGDSFRAKTYGAIHDLPGIELEDAVSKAWEKAQIGSPAQRCDMIPIALAHGHYNALAAAVMSLSKSSMDEPRKARFRESIQAHTGITGSDEGLRAWFDVNKDRLRFDPETKLFVSATEPVRTVLLPDDAVIEGTIRNLRTDGVIGYWNRPEDHIRFNIPELDMGTYRITAKYAAPAGYGGKVSFRLNDTKLEKKFSPTGGWRVSGEATVGDFEHLGGSLDITLTMLEQNGTNLVVIDLYSLTLEKKQPEGTRE